MTVQVRTKCVRTLHEKRRKGKKLKTEDPRGQNSIAVRLLKSTFVRRVLTPFDPLTSNIVIATCQLDIAPSSLYYVLIGPSIAPRMLEGLTFTKLTKLLFSESVSGEIL